MIARLRPETGYLDIFLSLFTFQDYSSRLEKALADYFKVKQVILTQSARGGLYFLFKSLPHKRVFIPSYTCWVVVEAARLAGKEVEFIDIQLSDYNMDIELLRKKIKPDSIILATHQFGIPCDIEEILKIAAENQCYVIEDNAAAFGSEYRGKKTGGFADASVISFEFTKTLTCGRGGAILFTDEDLYKKVKKIHDSETHSASFLFTIKYFSFLFFHKLLTQKVFYKLINMLFIRTRGLTTADPDYKTKPDILYTQKMGNAFKKLAYCNFRRIAGIISTRKNIAADYSESLKRSQTVEIPSFSNNKTPVFMRYPIRIKSMNKELFYSLASKKGVDLAFTFPYSCDPDKKNSPNSYMAAATVLNLPMYSSLKNKDVLKITQSLENK